MADTISFEIDVRKAMRIMKELDATAAKAVRDEMKAILEPVTSQAKALVPAVALSQWQKYGWRRRGSTASKDLIIWNPSKVKSGFQVQIGSMKRSGTNKYAGVAVMRNRNPAGSIFELAGIRAGSETSRFVLGLERSGHGAAKPKGRLLHLVWYGMSVSERHKYEAQMAAVFKRIQDQTNALLNQGMR